MMPTSAACRLDASSFPTAELRLSDQRLPASHACLGVTAAPPQALRQELLAA